MAKPPEEVDEPASVVKPAGLIAYAVEDCVCPPGYEGLSCEVFMRFYFFYSL